MLSHEGKCGVVREYRQRYESDVFIETGTYHGDMVAAMLSETVEIYSIELGDDLYKCATERFASNPKVHLFHGDSGQVLYSILPQFSGRLLFWLDAHYSGGETARGELSTPILKELDAILEFAPDSVILIDDARCFDYDGWGKQENYPTLGFLQRYVKGREFEVLDDIIRIHK